MTFIQSEFLALLGVVLVLYWGWRHRTWQNVVLLVSSAIFYGWIHPWFLLLMFGSAFLDYAVGLLVRAQPQHTRRWVTISLIGNLGLLGWFKYFDFFVQNVADALTALGVGHSVHVLGIFLPVGISFYTFQTLSYSLDIARGKLEPRKNLLDYLVFVSFFPQLVAGPVERASDLLPQVEAPRTITLSAVRWGIGLAIWGAVKKVCVADTIAPYVDRVFAIDDPSWGLVAVATVGFSLQILADFSGYTDIARGVAVLLGFQLTQNFDHPYLAVDPSDFWRRWHISFSSWIRDYLYIPLGGNRGGLRSTYGAMLLSGLWHGASWNFVLWGGYHATLLTLYRKIKPVVPSSWRGKAWSGPAAIVLMYGFTCVGWLLFREGRLSRIVQYAGHAPWSGSREEWVMTVALSSAVALCALVLVAGLCWERLVLPRMVAWRWAPAVETTLWTLGALSIAAFYRGGGHDFIYFAF